MFTYIILYAFVYFKICFEMKIKQKYKYLEGKPNDLKLVVKKKYYFLNINTLIFSSYLTNES